MLAADIRLWDRAARDGFTYEGDGALDTWRSHAADVLNGRRWRGDCDDLVSTVLDLLGRRGVPLDQRFRLLVDSDHSGGVNHMIGAVLTAEGAPLIVGDTYGAAYLCTSLKHRPRQYHRLDEWTEDGQPLWREGLPWA